MKNIFTKSKLPVLVIFADLLLIVAILFLMNYVQFLLNEDVRINLSEVVTQNKDVISSKLALELNNIEMVAKQLSDNSFTKSTLKQSTMEKKFLEYASKIGDTSLTFATNDGVAITTSGQELDISGRAYFKLGMNGTPNISERLISRINGEDVFVLCVPIILEQKTIGTLQKQYTPQEMYDICSASLFAEQGSSYIINSQGYILISSEYSQYTRESDNYYRIIYLSSPDASKQFEEDIKSNRSGFFEATIDGKRMFSAYTPINQIHDWYLISSIDTQAVSPNGNTVVSLFYFILLVVALLFLFSGVYYWELKRKQSTKLEQIAFVDTVTGGDSYTKFTVDLQNILGKYPSKQFYICSLDIDNFKFINSFYGYETGDSILQYIYHYYEKKLHDNEYISRVTGDQFILLLDDVSEQRLETLVDFEIVFNDIQIYMSAGIYFITDYMQSANFMLDKARFAASKNKGMHFKQIEHYNEEVDKENAHNEQMKRAIELALKEHEIIPYFQPKVDINTHILVGAEALARWCTKDGKLIPPNEFIPLCEQTGLITLVDLAIFEQTLQFIKESIDNGVTCVPISINFSRMHLSNRNFLNTVLEKLEQYQVPSDLIEFELTETVMFENSEIINEFINTLHANGLKISMDDFGSGYSSLHMLKDIEIDILKIDRGFLKDSESNIRQKIIFGSAVEMAQKLQIEVVVEGVETIDNVNMMKEFHCSYAQGYFFARPMDTADFRRIYTEGKI